MPRSGIDTTNLSAEAAAQHVILHLQSEGYLGGPS